MKGRIHKIVEADKIGFITDEKGVNRFFHFDQVIQGTPSVDQVVEFVESSNKKGPSAEKLVILPTLSTMKGRIHKIVEADKIGFITDEKGVNRFFHFDQVIQGTPSVDQVVEFVESSNKKGPSAEKLVILPTLWGMVKALPGKDFGFITDPDGQDRFFHFSQLKGTSTPGSIAVGDRVIFNSYTNKERKLAAENVFILKTSSPGETTTYKSPVGQKPSTLPMPFVVIVDLANVYRGITNDFQSKYEMKTFFSDLQTLSEAAKEYVTSTKKLDFSHSKIKAVYDPRTFKGVMNSSVQEIGPYLNQRMSQHGIEGIVLTVKDTDDDIVRHIVENIKNSYVCVLGGDRDIFDRAQTAIPNISGHEHALFIVSNSLFDSSSLYQNITNHIEIEKLCASIQNSQASDVIKNWTAVRRTKVSSSSSVRTTPSSGSPKSTPKAPPSTKKVETRLSSKPPAGKPESSSQSSMPVRKNSNESSSQPYNTSRIPHKNQHHFNISNTTFKCNSNEEYGILLVNCSDVTIENVQVLKSDLASLRIINCRRITIKNCTFEDSHSEQGISIVNSSDITLDHVTCRKNKNAGIDVRGGSHHIQINSSNLSGNDRAGLRVSGSSYHITCKDVKFNGVRDGNGIWFENVQQVEFSDECSFMSNDHSGIHLQDCTKVSFTACKFSDNKKQGIYLRNIQKATFERCEFNFNKGYAFDISTSEDVSALNCQLHDNDSGYGKILEKSVVKLMDPQLKGQGVFDLRGRSQLITNHQRSRIRTLVQGKLFDFDKTSEVIEL